MPRRTSDLRSEIVVRRRKVMKKATDTFTAKGAAAAGLSLRDNVDSEVLQNIIDDLDGSLLPPPSERNSASGLQQAGSAMVALKDLVVMLKSIQTLLLQSPDSKAESLLNECLALLLARWGGVIEWMLLFVRYTMPSDPSWLVSVGCTVQVLDMVAAGSESNAFKSEIASSPSTIDIFLDIVCLKAADDESPAVVRTPEAPSCRIADLLYTFARERLVREALVSRLWSVPSRRKDMFVTSVMQRIQNLGEKGLDSDTRSVTSDLSRLVGATVFFIQTPLRRALLQQHYPFETINTVNCLVEAGLTRKIQDAAFWRGLSESIWPLVQLIVIPGWGKMAHGMFEGGIIDCILYILPRVKPHPNGRKVGVEEAAREVLPLLTSSQVFHSHGMSGAGAELIGPSSRYTQGWPQSQLFKSVHAAFSAAIERGALAFAEEKSIITCCSLRHRLPTNGTFEKDLIDMKTCGGCHSVFYCSVTCQREDWIAFHSKECSELSSRRSMTRTAGISAMAIHDRLLCLEAVANDYLPSLPDVRRQELAAGHRPEDSYIIFFDFNTGAMGNLVEKIGPVRFNIPRYIKDMQASQLWQAEARTRRLVKAMEASKGSMVLVAGAFALTSTTHLHICAKMDYHMPHALSEGNYRTLNYSFNVTLRKPRGHTEGS